MNIRADLDARCDAMRCGAAGNAAAKRKAASTAAASSGRGHYRQILGLGLALHPCWLYKKSSLLSSLSPHPSLLPKFRGTQPTGIYSAEKSAVPVPPSAAQSFVFAPVVLSVSSSSSSSLVASQGNRQSVPPSRYLSTCLQFQSYLIPAASRRPPAAGRQFCLWILCCKGSWHRW